MTDEADRAMEAYPRAKARTLRFTLGAPRSASVVGDGSRAVFLRSSGPEDLVNGLWLSVFDQEGRHHEVSLADPRTLLEDAGREQVPAAELARRERSREGGEGIVDYSVDAAGDRVAFALNGRLWLSSIAPDGLTASTRLLSLAQGDAAVLNPAMSPDGSMVAYTTGDRLMVATIGANAGQDVERAVLALRPGADDRMQLGLAEFVAGEEMDRYQGFWWSPDSRALLVEHADASDEPIWYITDPAHPEEAPSARRYPQALTANACVGLSLVLLGRGDADPWVGEVEWDHQLFEYLALVRWQQGHRPLLLVQNRRQTEDRILQVQVPDVRQGLGQDRGMTLLDPEAAPKVATKVLQGHHNDQWIDLVPGLPVYRPHGGLVDAFIDVDADTTRLRLDGRVFSPAGCQIRRVLSAGDRDVLAVVSSDPRSFDLMRLGYDGSIHVLNRLPGVWTASRAGHGIVVSGRTMAAAQGQVRHCYLGADGDLDRLGAEGLGLVGEARPGSGAHPVGGPPAWEGDGGRQEHQDRPDCRAVDAGHINNQGAMSAVLADTSGDPGFIPNVDFVRMGRHELFAAIVRPSESSPYASADSLPVLLKPYGGPGVQQVVFNQSYYWESQWWADQGFLVLTADGRGTPGRGPAWDRAIFEDMAQVTLDDQLEALEALPDFAPEADLGHVAMIGWSYGGFLSALSVLRAPDRIHAACAGAPPTDWTLYDTHYTERYLGMDPAVYRRNGIIDDAPSLRRPLMLIHGFADDNVSVANTLRLSGALMAAGRPHTVLPLTGITHMTNDETVAENLLILQRDFLREALQNKTD